MEHSNENRAILVVDDESSVLFTYRMILEQQGYAATAANTAAEALQQVAQQDFDLLLCDLSLEEKRTGFEVFNAAPKTPRSALCFAYRLRLQRSGGKGGARGNCGAVQTH